MSIADAVYEVGRLYLAHLDETQEVSYHPFIREAREKVRNSRIDLRVEEVFKELRGVGTFELIRDFFPVFGSKGEIAYHLQNVFMTVELLVKYEMLVNPKNSPEIRERFEPIVEQSDSIDNAIATYNNTIRNVQRQGIWTYRVAPRTSYTHIWDNQTKEYLPQKRRGLTFIQRLARVAAVF